MSVFRNVVLLIVVTTAVPSAVAGLRAPLQGSGELDFIADMPVFHEADGNSRVDIALRVDHDQLAPEAPGDRTGRWMRDVFVTIKLAREGSVAVDTLQLYRVLGDYESTGDPSARPFEVLDLSLPVPPGRWAVTVGLAVLRENVRDAGLNPMIFTAFGLVGVVASEIFEAATFDEIVSRSARASGVLTVPRWPDDTARISDPEYRIETSNGSLPHPERLYGVAQDTLETYLEISGAPVDQIARVRVEIHDFEFGLQDATTVEIVPRGAVDATMLRLPLILLPDGHYTLRLIPEWTENVVLESDFVVSWKVERAVQARDDVMVEAELVLEPDDYERFARMSRPAQVQMMERFWEERDPTPGTARNEIYDRFRARLAHAERFFGESLRPGPLTDRGKIYIRYGPPSETDVVVMPSSRDELIAAIEQVHNTFAFDLQGSFARTTRTVDRLGQQSLGGRQQAIQDLEDGGSNSALVDEEAILDVTRNSMRVGQEGSFELWRYESTGDPLFEGMRVWSEDIDLRFLFVDRAGTGRYELDFSNLRTHH